MKRYRLIVLVAAAIVVVGVPALLLLFRPPPPQPVAPTALDTSHGPAFDVRVERPRTTRPVFGILPEKVERKLFGGAELRFDNSSPGAALGEVGANHLEFRADGWDLTLVTDAGGHISAATYLTFPILLSEKQRTLRCRPGDPAVGNIQTTARPAGEKRDGSFVVEVAICENIATGKVIPWPQSPLIVRGSFAGLP